MSKDEQKSKHPWRENFEGLALAIVMALTLKYFVLEAYKIPTGSMQPTLMGAELEPKNPKESTDKDTIYDRILVDKLAYLWSEPRRWEVIVFKFPLNQANNYIKRLIGLPGETVSIQNGNIYTKPTKPAPGENGDYRIARKPKQIQDSLWKEIYRLDPDEDSALRRNDTWQKSGSWEFVGESVLCSKSGQLAYRKPIYDYYTDGYPKEIRDRIIRNQREPDHNQVGDIRLSCTALANPSTKSFGGTIDTGTHRYQFSIAGPEGDGVTQILFDGNKLASTVRRLEFSQPAKLRFAHWDEHVELEWDGETVLKADLPVFTDKRFALADFPVTLQVEGGGIKISDLSIDRDIFYTAPNEYLAPDEWEVPEGKFFFLGDNTQNSYDGRLWKARWLRLGKPGDPQSLRRILGDQGTNTPNPLSLGYRKGEEEFRFTDQFGENHTYLAREKIASGEELQPFVPREFLLGRALLVFWPMPPYSDVSRWKIIF